MERRKQWYGMLAGFAAGVLFVLLIWLFVSGMAVQAGGPDENVQERADLPGAAQTYEKWERTAVYTGGDTVSYQGQAYRAKWWTQGEEPGKSDVWESLGVSENEAGVQPDTAGSGKSENGKSPDSFCP